MQLRVKKMLAAGADKEFFLSVDAAGATPLMHAAAAAAIDVCSRLVKSGADASKRDASGRTASSWAARKSYGTKMRFLAAMAVS